MSAPETLLAHGRQLLATARDDRATWERLSPSLEVERPEEGQVDRRELDRLQLAWALQYDATPDDADLIRAVFAYEVEWREVAPFQGIGETLEILGILIARERRVEDVWLLGRAKYANFDCGCGFDVEHLAAGGVAAAIAHVRAAARPAEERDPILARLVAESGAPLLDEAEVSAWVELRQRHILRALDTEPVNVWLDRALTLDARVLARQLVLAWSAHGGRERNAAFLSSLAGYWRDLGDFAEEATVREELLLVLSTPWDRAGQRHRAAAAARCAGHWQRALDHLDHAALLHRPRRDWRELGLGRDLVLEAYTLAAAAPPELARRALVLSEEFAAVTPRLPPVCLEQKALAEARELAAST